MKVPIKKILVIRFRRVGDAILTTALCTSLKKTFPDAQIHYVLNENIASLYDGHPDVDKVIRFNNRENANIFRFIGRAWKVMRREKYDVIIDTRSTFRTLLFAFFSLSTPYRIGTRKSYNPWVHNYRIDNRKDKTTDVISHLLMLLKPLEAEARIHYDPVFRLYISEQERENFRGYMSSQGVDFSRPVVLAAVAARLTHKIWDKEQMKIILRLMIDNYNAQVIFNYAPEEAETALNLHQEMQMDSNIFTSIEAKSLRELCALAANCNFFFGNEGGPRHLSQAMGVPGFAIFPPGIPKAMWLPTEDDKYQGASPDDVMAPAQQISMTYVERFALVSSTMVWEHLEPMLDKFLVKAVN